MKLMYQLRRVFVIEIQTSAMRTLDPDQVCILKCFQRGDTLETLGMRLSLDRRLSFEGASILMSFQGLGSYGVAG